MKCECAKKMQRVSGNSCYWCSNCGRYFQLYESQEFVWKVPKQTKRDEKIREIIDEYISKGILIVK